MGQPPSSSPTHVRCIKEAWSLVDESFDRGRPPAACPAWPATHCIQVLLALTKLLLLIPAGSYKLSELKEMIQQHYEGLTGSSYTYMPVFYWVDILAVSQNFTGGNSREGGQWMEPLPAGTRRWCAETVCMHCLAPSVELWPKKPDTATGIMAGQCMQAEASLCHSLQVTLTNTRTATSLQSSGSVRRWCSPSTPGAPPLHLHASGEPAPCAFLSPDFAGPPA